MSALLTDDAIVEVAQRQSVEQLLKTAPTPRTEPFIQFTQEIVEEPLETVPVMAKVIQPEVEKKLLITETQKKVIKPVIPTEPF